MNLHAMTFDAVDEPVPGDKWAARWRRSWPAYKAWFVAKGGDGGPSRSDCEAALARYMPELVQVHRRLTGLAGNSDRASRFLATWNPPQYLGGCTIAAKSDGGSVRLVRNYDLSPDLNEGLLLRTGYAGIPVMGMVEFLWGLSDGVNAAGLAAALAYGGRATVASGFGVTTILRYVLQTCETVEQALEVLRRVPSHMAYNIVLADRSGSTALAELIPGGGARVRRPAIATNHQSGEAGPDRPAFTRTFERHVLVEKLFDRGITPDRIADAFLELPLRETRYADGFGTLFTADYDPTSGTLALRWPEQKWVQSLAAFKEGRREIVYADKAPAEPSISRALLFEELSALRAFLTPKQAAAFDEWIREATRSGADWARFGDVFSR